MGYAYGDKEPIEECGCCGGEARAEFCDVGVGYARVSVYRCTECGASPGRGEWEVPPSPSSIGEIVTGYLILPSGSVLETTFDRDHQHLYRTMRTNLSLLLSRGAARITNLEGFAVDLPSFMSPRVKRALLRTLKNADLSWGLPYVMAAGAGRGREMSIYELMKEVSRLPAEKPEQVAVGPVP